MNTPGTAAIGVGIRMQRKLLSSRIGKAQWSLILMTVVIFLLIQGIGIWQELQFYKLRADAFGKEPVFKQHMEMYGCKQPIQVLPKVFLETIGIAVLLGLSAWLIISASGIMLFQRLSFVVKCMTELTVAILLGVFFAAVSIGFSDSWVYDFWCGPLFGLLRSSFVYHWSIKLIFPMTSALLFVAMCLSNGVAKKSRSLPGEQAHHE